MTIWMLSFWHEKKKSCDVNHHASHSGFCFLIRLLLIWKHATWQIPCLKAGWSFGCLLKTPQQQLNVHWTDGPTHEASQKDALLAIKKNPARTFQPSQKGFYCIRQSSDNRKRPAKPLPCHVSFMVIQKQEQDISPTWFTADRRMDKRADKVSHSILCGGLARKRQWRRRKKMTRKFRGTMWPINMWRCSCYHRFFGGFSFVVFVGNLSLRDFFFGRSSIPLHKGNPFDRLSARIYVRLSCL